MTLKALVLGLMLAVGLSFTAMAEPLKAGAPGAQFAHLYSDLPVDPQARFGRLSNGMTYVLYPNVAQPGKVVMRLRIGAGPLDEADEESGIAYLITFMAFSGSTHYPDGDLFRQLERQGIQMGAGQQTQTGEGETSYQIALPRNDAATLDTGFNVMSDVAFGLSFPETADQRDRALVVTQLNSADQPLQRRYDDWLRTAFAGQLLPERPQKGLRDIVLYTPREQIRRFYDTFYRPDRATLIIVGDIDPTALEKRIEKTFGAWKAKTPAPAVRDAGAYIAKGPRGTTYFEPGLPEIIDIAWLKPADTRFQNREAVRDMMREHLALAALNNRLERAAARPDSALARVGLNRQSFPRTGESLSLMVMPKPGETQKALTEALTLARQVGEYGFSDAEFARAADYEAGLRQRVDSAATRANEWIADMIAGSIEDRYVINSPAQDLQFYTGLKPDLSREAINTYIKALMQRDGPLISLSGPAPVSGLDAATLEKTYAVLEKAPVAAPEAETAKAWAYADFGAPVAPVRTEQDAALGTTRLTYANGLKVTIKPSKLQAGSVIVSVRALGGLKRLSPKTPDAAFALNFYDIFQGGLNKMSASEIEESLAGMNFDLAYRLTEDSAVLMGQSTPHDFSREMQLLRAFYSDAAFDPAYLERLRHSMPAYYTYASASPSGVMAMHLPRLVFDGDARLTPLSQADMLSLGNDRIADLIRRSLHDTPLEIVIVGDITPEQARPALDATFGVLPALPARYTPAPDGGETAHFPTTGLYKTLYHQGSAEQALMMIAFPTTDRYSDPKTGLGLDLLAEVLSLRHYEAGRDETGTTYVPLARHVPSTGFKGFGYLSATVQLYPGAESGFYTGFLGLIEGLKSAPVSADELLRGRQLLSRRMAEEDRNNGYWLAALSGIDANAGQRDYVLKRQALLDSLTPADLQALAKRYLDPSKALKTVVLPVPKSDSKAS